MDKRQARRALAWYLCGCGAVAGGILVYLWLLQQGYLPPRCLFLSATHLYCPGCGCTRAVRALFCGDVWLSLQCHPFPLATAVVLLYYGAAFARAALSDRRRPAPSPRPAIILALALPVYALVRDLLWLCAGIDLLGDLAVYGGFLCM